MREYPDDLVQRCDEHKEHLKPIYAEMQEANRDLKAGVAGAEARVAEAEGKFASWEKEFHAITARLHADEEKGGADRV